MDKLLASQVSAIHSLGCALVFSAAATRRLLLWICQTLDSRGRHSIYIWDVLRACNWASLKNPTAIATQSYRHHRLSLTQSNLRPNGSTENELNGWKNKKKEKTQNRESNRKTISFRMVKVIRCDSIKSVEHMWATLSLISGYVFVLLTSRAHHTQLHT